MSYEPAPAIKAVPPTPSLLTAARRLPDGIDWRTGLSFLDTLASSKGHAWPFAPGTSHADKTGAGTPLVPQFLPFTIYVPIECAEVLIDREDELLAQAADDIEAVTAGTLARELWTGETVNASGYANNPSLTRPDPAAWFDDTHTVLSGTANPVTAMGLLAEAYQTATGGKGGITIHAPAAVIPYLLAERAIGQQGDLYVGPLGSVVSPGPLYPRGTASGPKTSATHAGVDAASGQAWLFATGPVEYAVGPVTLLPEDRAARMEGARRTNVWQVWAERQAIYRFPTSVVIAQLVTIPSAE